MYQFKSILSAVVFCLYSLNTYSQSVNLLGIKLENDSVKIIEWNNYSPSVYTEVPTPMFTFLAGSSTYNAVDGSYYVRGLIDSGSMVVKYNANVNTQQDIDIISFYNGSIETDMSTGLMYYYLGNEFNEVYVYKYDPTIDSSIALGMLPWSTGLGASAYVYYPDATCFNSNEHIYHFTISDSSGKYLISVPVNDSVFSYTILPLTGVLMPGNIGLEYDNNYNTIYSMFPTYDSMLLYPTMNIGEINPNTGVNTLQIDLPDLLGYEVFNRCFDQFSNSMVFVAYDDSTFERKMYIYQMDSMQLSIYDLPSAISTYEIEVNNTAYAIARYGIVNTISEVPINPEAIRLYPVPTSGLLYIESDFESDSPIEMNCYNLTGQLLYSEKNIYTNMITYDANELQPGVYFIEIKNEFGKSQKKRFIKM